MPPISVQIRKGDALGYELMSEVVEVSRPSRSAASASSVTRACALFATHRTQTRSARRWGQFQLVCPVVHVSWALLREDNPSTCASGTRQIFGIVRVARENDLKSRSILRKRTELSLQRVYALSELGIGLGSTTPVKRGNFGEGQAIAGERIWNIT